MPIEWTIEELRNRLDSHHSGADVSSGYTKPERVLMELPYVITCIGESSFFQQLESVLQHLNLFELIGALGVVSAARQLEPLYQEFESEFHEDGGYAFMLEHEEVIADSMKLVESSDELELLLHSYCLKHDEEIGGGPPYGA